MAIDEKAFATLIAKDEIRDLVLLYSRGVDRKDYGLLGTLYTKDGTDDHAIFFKGTADDYVKHLTKSLPYLPYSGHHVCNHMISVDGDTGEGEVYAIAYHIMPDGKGGWIEDLMGVRYIDKYRKENGRWYFASRDLSLDWRRQTPIPPYEGSVPPVDKDPSYRVLSSRLFARGPRA